MLFTTAPTVAQADVKRFVDAINQVEPGLIKAYRKEMKSALKPFAQKVKSAVPKGAPLSGMEHFGRTAWPDRITASVTTSTARRRGKAVSSIVAIKLSGGGGDPGLQIAELAGIRRVTKKGLTREYSRAGRSRRHSVTTQGVALMDNLAVRYPFKGSGGRFAFKASIANRPEVIAAAMKILEKYVDEVNAKLGVK